MHTAIVFNEESGFSREMNALEFERRYVGNPALKIEPTHPEEIEHLKAVSKDDALPLSFRKSHFRMGNSATEDGGQGVVNACWVRPKGFGDNDHLFGPTQSQTLKEGIAAGKSVLLAINMDLTPRPVSFEHMQEAGAKSLTNWIAERDNGFITIPVKSAEDAVKQIKKAHDLGASTNRIFAVHRNAVVPYSNFYLGDKREKMKQLYSNMQDGFSSVSQGKTRAIGFPRLICFVPTDKTIETNGLRGMKGNHINGDTGKPYVSDLIFTDREEAKATDPYKILQGNIADAQPEYVLACPGARITNDPNGWKMLHWVIKDVGTQTVVLDEEGQAKLHAHIEEMGYSSRLIKEAIERRMAAEDNDNDQDHDDPAHDDNTLTVG